MISKKTFTEDGARFQVKIGCGQLVRAGVIAADPQRFKGLGVFHDLFRDHEWLPIYTIAPRGDGGVTLCYLFLSKPHVSQEPAKVEERAGGATTTTTVLTRLDLLCANLELDPDDEVLLSVKPVKCLQGETRTVTTVDARVLSNLPPIQAV